MSEDSSTLSVLETLAESADIPQRKIADQTGLNLAKVNFVIKKLVSRGWVKLRRVRDNPHKLRYLYLLTPEGMAAKSRLAYRFVQRAVAQYSDVQVRVERSLHSMANQGVARVVLWGSNEITALCLRLLSDMDHGPKVVGVVDPACVNSKALCPAQLSAVDADAVLVCDPDISELCDDLPVHWLV